MEWDEVDMITALCSIIINLSVGSFVNLVFPLLEERSSDDVMMTTGGSTNGSTEEPKVD